MTAGLQVWNDSNSVQIDGVSQSTVFLRSGSVGTSTLAHAEGGLPASYANIAVSSSEIVAFGCPGYPVAVAGLYQGTLTFHVLGPAGAVVNYWIFGRYTPSGTRVGLEVYDASQTLIYDSGRLPMRVLGEVAGVGDFSGWPGGRTLALAVWAQYYSVTTAVVPLNQGTSGSPNAIVTTHVTSGFGHSLDNGTIHIQDTEYLTTASNPTPYSQVEYLNGTWANGLDNKYTVIDVTGY